MVIIKFINDIFIHLRDKKTYIYADAIARESVGPCRYRQWLPSLTAGRWCVSVSPSRYSLITIEFSLTKPLVWTFPVQTLPTISLVHSGVLTSAFQCISSQQMSAKSGLIKCRVYCIVWMLLQMLLLSQYNNILISTPILNINTVYLQIV